MKLVVRTVPKNMLVKLDNISLQDNRIDFDTLKPITYVTNLNLLDRLETLEIHKNRHNCMVISTQNLFLKSTSTTRKSR